MRVRLMAVIGGNQHTVARTELGKSFRQAMAVDLRNFPDIPGEIPATRIEEQLPKRMGAFSVDREGTDRRALRCAIELLTKAQRLVIFPEGEIHHLNNRLKPLLEGVAFIALSAQKQIRKDNNEGTIWILPAAIRYDFIQDVRPAMEAALQKLEHRLLWWKPKPGMTLAERTIDYGEALLTVKEKEKLGRSFEDLGDLSVRITHFINALLIRHEEAYFGKSAEEKSVPLRIKALRRKCIELWMDESLHEDKRREARAGLDDIQLALQLSSYPGDYIRENPVPERMAETIEKYLEDVFGEAHSLGERRASLSFGAPLNMADYLKALRPKTPSLVTAITDDLEQGIRQLMDQG